MWSWYAFWLILHILAVVIAFGPTLAYGLIVTLGQKHPEHSAFATRVILSIDRRMTIPLAIAVPIFGAALILTANFDLFKSEWLLIAITLYAITFFYDLLIQMPATARMLRAQEGGQSGVDLQAMGKKLQMGGTFMGIMFVTILVLMVWKPGSCQGVC